MKLFVYLLSGLLMLALAGLFVFKKPNGQAWLDFNDLLPNKMMIEQEIDSVVTKLTTGFEEITITTDDHNTDGEVKIYRWKDKHGNWSYSDKPNASVEQEEVVFDSKDIIVLPEFEPTKPSESASLEKKSSQSAKAETSTSKKILNLYNDANNVQKLMDDRDKRIQEAIER